jgi:hypothetical protein
LALTADLSSRSESATQPILATTSNEVEKLLASLLELRAGAGKSEALLEAELQPAVTKGGF